MLKHLPKTIFTSFQNLLYPPLCLYCSETLPLDEKLFCRLCVEQLELIDPSLRCPFCFTQEYSPERNLCAACYDKDPILARIASAFDYIGPAACLVKRMKYADQPYLAKGAAGYLGAQFCRLDWPVPDVIVPVPISISRSIERGYNQSLLLAQTLSEILQRPVLDVLKRTSEGFPQAGLKLAQRLELQSSQFSLQKGKGTQVHDKCILLVDDVLTSGSTLRRCAEILREQCPDSIYGLTVCRAIK